MQLFTLFVMIAYSTITRTLPFLNSLGKNNESPTAFLIIHVSLLYHINSIIVGLLQPSLFTILLIILIFSPVVFVLICIRHPNMCVLVNVAKCYFVINIIQIHTAMENNELSNKMFLVLSHFM